MLVTGRPAGKGADGAGPGCSEQQVPLLDPPLGQLLPGSGSPWAPEAGGKTQAPELTAWPESKDCHQAVLTPPCLTARRRGGLRAVEENLRALFETPEILCGGHFG